MKILHSCLLLLLIPGIAHAQLSSRRLQARPIFFRAPANADVVFRGQDIGVPLPADPGFIAPPISDPVMPGANTFAPSPHYGSPLSMPVPAVPSSPVPGTPIGQTDAAGMPLVTGPSLGSPAPSTWNAFSPQIYSDPFIGSPAPPVAPMPGGVGAPYTPYAAPSVMPYGNGGFATPGANGPAPFRNGWHTDLDIEWMPQVSAAGVSGEFEQFGVDYDLGYSGAFMPGWMMTWTNQFRLRNWDGPTSGPGLPGKAFRFGWDFMLESANSGPVSLRLGITPSINSDLDDIGKAAFQLDGRGMFIFQLDQYWSMVLGAGYWDRVSDRVIPHVGVVYRDDFWEWRLMYPESTISLFLGNESQWSKWLYARAEYHVEAYEVATSGGGRDQVELEDYRILVGFRMDAGMYSWITEAGWVFDRNVDFGAAANGSFAPETGFIGRIGWKY